MLAIRKFLPWMVAAVAICALAGWAIGAGQLVRLAMGPELPSGALADPQYFRDAVLANERSGSDAQRKAFDDYSREIIARSASLDGELLSLEAARALALFDNAHTHVTDGRLKRLPLRFHWFADGLYIVKARPEHEALLGARVVAIEQRDPEELLTELKEFIPGLEGWRRYRSEYFLSAPATLRALAISDDPDSIRLELKKRDGNVVTLAIKADAQVLPSDAFREFRHLLPLDDSFETKGWRRLADGIATKPLYLRDMPSPYSVSWLEGERAVYMRLNASVNTRDVDVPRLLDSALESIKSHQARHAIVDLRFCWGGDYMLTRSFSAKVAAALPADGKVFVITGPNTFSAGLILAARLKHFAGGKTVIVGEPAGDRLQFWAEGFEVALPKTGVEMYLTTAAHDLKNGCAILDRDCFVLDKFVGVAVSDLTPNIPSRNTFEQFMSGRDAPMEAIRAAAR